MRSAALLAMMFLVCATAEAAQIAKIVRKSEPLRIGLPRPRVVDREPAASQPDPRVPAQNTGKLLAAPPIDCESDGTLDPSTTLVLDPGDLAGSIISIPPEYSPYVIGELRLGLFDFNAEYPAQLDLLILELDASGLTYDSIAAFTVDIEGEIAAEGELLEVDLREFEVAGTRELVVLYGDAGGGPDKLLLPGADATPRCAKEQISEVCSILLPSGSEELFIYGIVDEAECARSSHHILMHDLVLELVLDVDELKTSFGGLKARY